MIKNFLAIHRDMCIIRKGCIKTLKQNLEVCIYCYKNSLKRRYRK